MSPIENLLIWGSLGSLLKGLKIRNSIIALNLSMFILWVIIICQVFFCFFFLFFLNFFKEIIYIIALILIFCCRTAKCLCDSLDLNYQVVFYFPFTTKTKLICGWKILVVLPNCVWFVTTFLHLEEWNWCFKMSVCSVPLLPSSFVFGNFQRCFQVLIHFFL